MVSVADVRPRHGSGLQAKKNMVWASPGLKANNKNIRRLDMFHNRSLGGLFKSSVLLIAVLGLCSPKSWSDSITFSESEKDTLKCTTDTGCDTTTTGKFTMKGTFFTGVDLAAFRDLLVTNTELDVSVGDWSGGGLFGDDPKYKNGGTKATINLIDTSSCSDKDVTHGTIKFSGSSKGIAIAVSTKTGSTACDDYEDSAIADEDAGETGAVTNIVTVSVDIFNDADELSTNIDVTVIGVASVKSVVKNGETDDLNSVKVGGKQ